MDSDGGHILDFPRVVSLLFPVTVAYILTKPYSKQVLKVHSKIVYL